MEEKYIFLGVMFALIGVGIGFGIYHLAIAAPENYPYQINISDIPVYSKVPIENLKNWEKIALLENNDKAAIICNFEIAAIFPQDREGNKVEIEKGKKGVYLRQNSAYIRGMSDSEILNSCHIFSCILLGVECPENFQDVKNLIPYENEMNLVLDKKLGNSGARAYSEILGVFGFIQAIIVDVNKDKKFSEQEKLMNKVFIRPYIKNESKCLEQPFKNIIQETSGNESIDCNALNSGVFLLYSENESKIEVQSNKIILYGNEDTIYEESVILRDILSPEWILAMYGLI